MAQQTSKHTHAVRRSCTSPGGNCLCQPVWPSAATARKSRHRYSAAGAVSAGQTACPSQFPPLHPSPFVPDPGAASCHPAARHQQNPKREMTPSSALKPPDPPKRIHTMNARRKLHSSPLPPPRSSRLRRSTSPLTPSGKLTAPAVLTVCSEEGGEGSRSRSATACRPVCGRHIPPGIPHHQFR
jgi:hypothetical protein